MRKLKFFPVFIIFTCALFTASGESFELNLFIQRLEHASPPVIFNDVIVFSYEPQPSASIVAARFSHENYATLHVYRQNENGVFILTLPVPFQCLTLKYRIMIDGVWTHDPANLDSERDDRGTIFSVFRFETSADIPIESPVLLPDGIVEFSLQTNSGSMVMIAGDFNAYDPFTHRMSEISPGLYRIRLKIFPGNHYYYFVVDGLPMIDPRNPALGETVRGQRLSLVTVR